MLLLMDALLVLALFLLLIMLRLWRQQGGALRRLQERVDGLENALRESLATQVSLYREVVQTPAITPASQDSSASAPSPAWDDLPAKIVNLAGQGLSAQEIAQRLGLGVADVELSLRLRR